MDRKAPVRWKEDDLVKLSDHLVRKNVGFWDEDFLKHLREAADQVLTPDRRKIIKGRDNVKDMESAMKKAAHRYLKECEAENAARQADAHREQQQAAEREAAEREAADNIARAEAELQVQRTHPLDVAMDVLARELATRFFYHMTLAFEEQFGAHFSNLAEKMPMFRQVAADRRKKVLVIGLRQKDSAPIRQEYPELDLRFVESGQNSASIVKQKLGHAETVLGMVDFMGHSQQDHVIKHPGYVRVAGGMDKLRHHLNALMKKNNL